MLFTTLPNEFPYDRWTLYATTKSWERKIRLISIKKKYKPDILVRSNDKRKNAQSFNKTMFLIKSCLLLTESNYIPQWSWLRKVLLLWGHSITTYISMLYEAHQKVIPEYMVSCGNHVVINSQWFMVYWASISIS